jgi:GGDEF domain-containing protein
MSMTRQLWLSILASMLIALGVSLFASLLNARSYLESQLAMKNQDNATTLALALSQGNSDRDGVVLAVTALFDGGHYDLIQVVDPRGGSLVDKVAPPTDTGVPGWFTRLLPIRSLPGRAEITSGWQPIGTLTLMSHAEFAYRALWDTALAMSAAILAAGLLGGLLASLVLRRISRPLGAVLAQAHAINEHRFITMPEPRVPELRELAAAMNDTVNRLRIDFDEDARRYERMRRQANFDPLTGLANRTHFLASLDSALDMEGSPFDALAIIRLRKLGKINRALGRDVADQLLRQIGETVDEVADRCLGTLAGRLNGADFALLLPAGCDPKPALDNLLLELRHTLDSLAGDYATVYIAFAAFTPGDNPARVLARIDTTLAAADVDGGSSVREAPADTPDAGPTGGEEWRTTLRRALDGTDALRLAHYPLRVGDSPRPPPGKPAALAWFRGKRMASRRPLPAHRRPSRPGAGTGPDHPEAGPRRAGKRPWPGRALDQPLGQSHRRSRLPRPHAGSSGRTPREPQPALAGNPRIRWPGPPGSPARPEPGSQAPGLQAGPGTLWPPLRPDRPPL